MAGVLISVAATLVNYFGDPIIREAKYLFCVYKIERDLENTREEMIQKQERVQKRIEEELRRANVIVDAVNEWKNKVQSLITEVEKLEEDLSTNSGCVLGWFPNWRRYRICKQMAEKIEAMKLLTEKSEFEPFSQPAPLLGIDHFSSRDFVYFQSTKLAFEQLLEALRDESCYMIGLYGMGGSGKTTLAKEVGKKAKSYNLFDHVVVTTASQKPDFRKIQKEIAEQLSFKLEEETEAPRAMRLSQRLTSGEQILIILDDVWAHLNLSENIGIPFGSNHKGCKVLMTTRLSQVCNLMDCQRYIPLDLLSEEDAWTLFCKCASIDDHTPSSLLTVAHEIVRECKGLPIGIEAVGTTLRGKPFDHWMAALDNLKSSKPLDVEEGVRDAFTCLQLSYNHLRSQEAKSLLLMCAVFPEDHIIIIEDLFKYAVGCGLFVQFKSFDIARSKLSTVVDNLIDSCLLTRLGDYLKMHDMVRDLVLWLASKRGRILLDAMTLVEDEEAIRDCNAVCLWSQSIEFINSVSHKMYAPKLEILLLDFGFHQFGHYWDLSDSSFHMNALKVMSIISCSPLPVSFPQSAHWSTNLRTLRLVRMGLGEISFVASLTRLEILDLTESVFKELPNGIENLHKLKLLDLTRCEIENSCDEVLARCSKLEELYAFPRWDSQFISYECFREDTCLLKLQRYCIKVGRENFDRQLWSSRCLSFEKLDMSTSSAIIKNLLQRARVICLQSLKGGCNSIIPELIPKLVQPVGGMNQNELETLLLFSCSEIKCLFNTNPGECNLCNLQELRIVDCPKLTSLFPIFAAQTMSHLEKLYIKNCSKLKCIIINEEGGSNTGEEILPVSQNEESQNLVEPCFPRLTHLEVRKCNKLKTIFSTSIVGRLPQLRSMCISELAQLEEVFKHTSKVGIHNEKKIMVPELEDLRLENLPNLIEISQGFKLEGVKFREVVITECPKLFARISAVVWERRMEGTKLRFEQKIAVGMNGEQISDKVPSPLSSNLYAIIKLFHIERVDVDEDQQQPIHRKLISLWSEHLIRTGPIPIKLLCPKYLDYLELSGCGKLKFVFSVDIVKVGLPALTSLAICGCDELEEIIAENQETQCISNAQLCFPKLEQLVIMQCNKLTRLFSTFTNGMLPQLNSLCISEANLLKELFGCISEDETSNRGEIVLPNLTKIKLNKLPIFTDFCRGLKVQPGKLCKILIHECPQFAPIFGSTQRIALAEWRTMAIKELDQWLWKEVSNDVIEEQEIVVISRVKWLYLKHPLLMSLWNGPTSISFQNLQLLRVAGCSKLKCIFSVAVIRSVPQLMDLIIEGCDELEGIISNADNDQQWPLSNPSSSHPPQFKFCFPKLRTLEVIKCSKLKCVLSVFDTAAQLPQLELLKVKGCYELEHVLVCASDRVEREGRDGEMMQIVLPKLKELKLKRLPILTDICRGFHSLLQLPALTSYKVKGCSKLSKITILALKHFKKTEKKEKEEEEEVEESDQLSSGDDDFFATDDENVSEDNWKHKDNDGDYFAMDYDNDGDFLAIDDENVSEGPIPTQLLRPEYLRCLKVSGCGKLKFVFSVDIVKVGLPALTSLVICDCDELEEIIAENEDTQWISNAQLCFPKLKHLEIRQCNKLTRLFSTLTNGMLPQLNSLYISEADLLKELFGYISEDETSNREEIVLPNLTKIKLKKLPIFIDFCRGLKVQPGKLCQILIHKCPQFAPILGSTQRIALAQRRTMVCNEVSNDVIEEQEMVVISRVKLLYLKHSLLMSLWNGPTPISFQNLRLLRVTGCSKLKCIFSVAVIRSVPQLMGLMIESCDELEGIISNADNDQQGPLQNPSNSHPPQFKFCFPKLRFLTVNKCSKLKCVLSVFDMAAQLPRLEGLFIKGCCELEHVLVCASDMVEREGRDGEMMQTVLPKLRELTLKRLPILTDICRGFHSHLQLPALRWYEVNGCSRLSSTAIAALKHFTNTEKKEESSEEEEESSGNDDFLESNDEYVSEDNLEEDNDDSVDDEDASEDN